MSLPRTEDLENYLEGESSADPFRTNGNVVADVDRKVWGKGDRVLSCGRWDDLLTASKESCLVVVGTILVKIMVGRAVFWQDHAL